MKYLSKFIKFSFKKMHLKMLSAKCRPFCLGLNVLNEIQSFQNLLNFNVVSYCEETELLICISNHSLILEHYGLSKFTLSNKKTSSFHTENIMAADMIYSIKKFMVTHKYSMSFHKEVFFFYIFNNSFHTGLAGLSLNYPRSEPLTHFAVQRNIKGSKAWW